MRKSTPFSFMLVSSSLCALFVACSDERLTSTPADASPFLQFFQPASSSIEADGASTTILKARVSRQNATERRLVSFSASSGALLLPAPSLTSSSTVVNVDSSGTASVLLRAPRTAGTALLSASAGHDVLNSTISFTSALPDYISIEAATPTISAGSNSSVAVRALLSRNVGLVSPGTEVQFTARTESGVAVGSFGLIAISDDNGVSTTRFTVPDSSVRSRIILTAQAQSKRAPALYITASTTISIVLEEKK